MKNGKKPKPVKIKKPKSRPALLAVFGLDPDKEAARAAYRRSHSHARGGAK